MPHTQGVMQSRRLINGFWLAVTLVALALPVARSEPVLPAMLKLGLGVHATRSVDFGPPDSVLPDFPVQLKPTFRFHMDLDGRFRRFGWESITFPVKLTNTSSRPLYYLSQLPTFACPREFKRASAREEFTFRSCGVGVAFHELAPGQTLSFSEYLNAEDAGREVYLEVTVYTVKDDDASAVVIPSAVTVFR